MYLELCFSHLSKTGIVCQNITTKYVTYMYFPIKIHKLGIIAKTELYILTLNIINNLYVHYI